MTLGNGCWRSDPGAGPDRRTDAVSLFDAFVTRCAQGPERPISKSGKPMELVYQVTSPGPEGPGFWPA